ncbi:MAG: glutamate-5-semialdehyde dehydrogenase [Succinivibrio dextrinosolvens]|nr:glutamate-5-semialdehyde dehydrogenase [Succinivibrio dextrinosolvens]MDY6466057.1 glutamate-5-semialdehyde dehydrogenase [Succinivibrio dextrinosolvens]MDY6470896.1 glutamate-5-semialdehyde dehydrogenase [Succinivibrio dextrinosolvens]
MTDIIEIAKRARNAGYDFAQLSTSKKNEALYTIASMLREASSEIFETNKKDVDCARAKGLTEAMVDRLTFTQARFDEMVDGLDKVAALEDPCGKTFDGRVLPNGLEVVKKSVPFGVVGVIYESRPNVTVDIAGLCLKSGNACILRGGSEAFNTNSLLHSIICRALEKCGLNPDGVSFVDSTDREMVSTMLSLDQYIDVLIPRGGEKLQRMCQRESSIPVIIGGFGISHIFVDESADLERSVEIIFNAKTQKPSACNSLDTLLVHEKIADKFLPMVLNRLSEKKVEVLAHGDAFEKCSDYPFLEKGTDEDFDREFLALKMNVRIVPDVYEAITHLRVHNASHSDSILTDSRKNAELFVKSAGSACVYVNASTRFSDGGQFGLGAEVAISTQKLHARGPMALQELTTYQYVCTGDYLFRH